MRRFGLILILCTLLVMVALPAVAGQKPIDRVPAGLDYWQTLSFGATAYSFAKEPLPAGFFCAGSAPFTGVVFFEGVPLRTEPAGILGTTDTVIERLDDAVFNARGEATSRLRARALGLRGIEPIKTACGNFKVTAELTEDQPVTRITFHREHKYGGIFNADLRLQVRVSFTNLQNGKVLSIVRDLYLPTVGDAPFACGKAAQACAVQPASLATATLLTDGRPLMTEGPAGRADKAVAQTCITGCKCNPENPSQCMTTYCWHLACPNPRYDCELHFTHTPCQLGYTQFCASETDQANDLEQLRDLEQRGLLFEKPEVILKKQMRSAAEIEREQAAKDKEQQKQ